MTFLELAEKVLKETLIPMTSGGIWEYAVEKGYTVDLGSTGATPDYSLSAQLYTVVKDHNRGPIRASGSRPKKFYLEGITPESALGKLDSIKDYVDQKLTYKEADLHKALVAFVHYHYGGYCKTINHARSSKKKYMQWTHPDVVGVSFPGLEWEEATYDLSETLGEPPVRLLSFELKLQLNFGNLRESFFQAVSNSSWAHEGYLVTANIQQDAEFMVELGRLSESFGLGVILLDLEQINATDFFNYSEEREALDWSFINNLASQNSDFKDLLLRIRKDLKAREVRQDWYDRIEPEEEIERFFKNRI